MLRWPRCEDLVRDANAPVTQSIQLSERMKPKRETSLNSCLMVKAPVCANGQEIANGIPRNENESQNDKERRGIRGAVAVIERNDERRLAKALTLMLSVISTEGCETEERDEPSCRRLRSRDWHRRTGP